VPLGAPPARAAIMRANALPLVASLMRCALVSAITARRLYSSIATLER
jgi:hypothetical protein